MRAFDPSEGRKRLEAVKQNCLANDTVDASFELETGDEFADELLNWLWENAVDLIESAEQLQTLRSGKPKILD